MIITCPCGDKKFNVDASLIPQEGRTLQCGFCDRKWFFKKENTDDEIKILEKKIPEPVIEDNKNLSENIKEDIVDEETAIEASPSADDLKSMLNDPRYWDTSKRDPAYVKRVTELYEKTFNKASK